MIQLLQGDALSVLSTLAPGSIQTVITSPPFYGLRKYTKNDPREIGQEAAPDCLAWARREPPCGACYVCALRAVFAAVWRVLRDDGTCWINLGDSYTRSYAGVWGTSKDPEHRRESHEHIHSRMPPPGMKEKNLLLIPARVALALQSDGWIVRSDVIWSKPNCMPESVTDRPTRAHEYVYLLSKQARYYYDAAAIAEETTDPEYRTKGKIRPTADPMWADSNGGNNRSGLHNQVGGRTTRNKRSVWHIATRPYAGAHFATMPEALVEIPLLASSSAQACETCGAAWGRVVEKIEIDPEKTVSNPKQAHLGHGTSARVNTPEYGHAYVSTRHDTGGFAPRCACPANTGAACSTVLDPFAGTFTVGRVAERFGRNAIGIELNPDYTELSDARTNGVQKELFV